jgi:hypothetical protein
MWLMSWLRNRIPNRARRAQRRPATPRFRPRLEALEARWLPSTLTVTTYLDYPGNAGDGSLRGEIAAAHAGDTINFAPALNGQTITLTNGQLVISKSLTIQGPGAGQLAVSGGGYLGSRVFEVAANTNVALSGLTIRDGAGRANPILANSSNDPQPWDGYGGGVLNFGTLTVSGCTLSGNSADPFNPYGSGYGGGIYNDYGATLTVSGCTLSGNSAWLGGGILNRGKYATVSGCTLSGNSASYGGGIYNTGTLTVSGCTLTGNSAGVEGGGIDNGSKLTVSDSIFSDNNPDNIFGKFTDKGGNTFG